MTVNSPPQDEGGTNPPAANPTGAASGGNPPTRNPTGSNKPSSNPTGTIAALPFKQQKPKFGGLQEVGTALWAAWKGGKPNGSWTALDNPNPVNIEPNQYRSPSRASRLRARVNTTEYKAWKPSTEGTVTCKHSKKKLCNTWLNMASQRPN